MTTANKHDFAIDGVALLTASGFLLCRHCLALHDTDKFVKQITGCAERIVRRGDTYSDEICDYCGEEVDRDED